MCTASCKGIGFGFVLRVLGNLTQHIEQTIGCCHNYVRNRFLDSKDLVVRKN